MRQEVKLMENSFHNEETFPIRSGDIAKIYVVTAAPPSWCGVKVGDLVVRSAGEVVILSCNSWERLECSENLMVRNLRENEVVTICNKK